MNGKDDTEDLKAEGNLAARAGETIVELRKRVDELERENDDLRGQAEH